MTTSISVTALPAWARAPQARIDWFRAQRLGLFLHWGPVALTGQDISWSRSGPRPLDMHGGSARIPPKEYDQLHRRFDPDRFDARAWVDLALSAGMRYLVFTSKHHDGFSMYGTRLSPHGILATPFARDPLRELADACHAAGLGFGIYYSGRDWFHPDYGTPDHQRYVDFMHGQVRELLTGYGQVDLLWFDSIAGKLPWWRPAELLAMIRDLQPNCLVNDRSAAILADYRGTPPEYQGDFQTPEHRIGTFQREPCWESCMTLSGHQWSYGPHLQPQSLATCLEWLWRSVGGDGNLLLNVGPDATGRIPADEALRLRELGRWIADHPGAIHGTRGGPWRPSADAVATQAGEVAHLAIFGGSWRELILPPLPIEPVSATIEGRPLTIERLPNQTVRLGGGAPSAIGPAVVRIHLASTPAALLDADPIQVHR